MTRCEAGCSAQVRFEITFLLGNAWTRTYNLDLDGVEVTVTIVDGEDMVPEVFSVEPPPGYIAEPTEIPVSEGGSAVIAVLPLPMS